MKKRAIILDANVLIDFIEEEKIDKFGDFYSLISLSSDPLISVYIVDIAKHEWDVIKEEKFKRVQTTIDDRLKSFKKFLENPDVQSLGDYSQKGMELIKRYKNKYEAIAKLRIYEIDKNLIPSAEIISHNNILVSKGLARYVLEFKSPFFSKGLKNEKRKIESEDAAIFLSSYYYFKSKKKDFDKVFFVTGNKYDFSNPTNPMEPHPDIKNEFEEANITYTYRLENLFEHLKIDRPHFDSISQKIQEENSVTFEYMSDKDFINCPKCKNRIHMNSTPIQIKVDIIYYICLTCKNVINSGKTIIDDIY